GGTVDFPRARAGTELRDHPPEPCDVKTDVTATLADRGVYDAHPLEPVERDATAEEAGMLGRGIDRDDPTAPRRRRERKRPDVGPQVEHPGSRARESRQELGQIFIHLIPIAVSQGDRVVRPGIDDELVLPRAFQHDRAGHVLALRPEGGWTRRI